MNYMGWAISELENCVSSHNNHVGPVIAKTEGQGGQIEKRESEVDALAAKVADLERRVAALTLEQMHRRVEERSEIDKLRVETENGKIRVEVQASEAHKQFEQLNSELQSLTKADREKEEKIVRFTSILNELQNGGNE